MTQSAASSSTRPAHWILDDEKLKQCVDDFFKIFFQNQQNHKTPLKHWFQAKLVNKHTEIFETISEKCDVILDEFLHILAVRHIILDVFLHVQAVRHVILDVFLHLPAVRHVILDVFFHLKSVIHVIPYDVFLISSHLTRVFEGHFSKSTCFFIRATPRNRGQLQ